MRLRPPSRCSKGQGANATLVDAPLLARCVADALLASAASPASSGKGLPSALSRFEREMGSRAEPKVVASREAALLYHSAAAVESSSYGFSGVDDEKEAAAYCAELQRSAANASDAAGLERKAVECLARCRERSSESSSGRAAEEDVVATAA